MPLLILGMLIFFGIHLVPTLVVLRQNLIRRTEEAFFKITYSCAALVGLTLIIIGKARSAYLPIWEAPRWAYHLMLVAMPIALILLPAAYLPANLKRFLRHPFLTGVALWALSHLLVNGDLASIILFGGFGIFALFDIWSTNCRGAHKTNKKYPIYFDIVVVAIGVILSSLLIFLHPYLFGVPAIL